MAKVTFKPYPQYETLLLPPSLSELIPATHPVRLVNAVLDKIDISELKSTYVGGGASSYNPRMLLKVIVYGYFPDVNWRKSSRRTSTLCGWQECPDRISGPSICFAAKG